MKYQFDEDKATQASVYLMHKYGGRLNYMKLIKLLYLANRASMAEIGAPIVPDTYSVMPKGPVLSTVLDRINYPRLKGETSPWYEAIDFSDPYTLKIKNDPGVGNLSRRSLRILDQVDAKFHGMSPFELVAWMHDKKNIPEWSDPKGSSYQITIEAILRAIGKTEEQIEWIVTEEKQYQKEAEVFDSIERLQGQNVSC